MGGDGKAIIGGIWVGQRPQRAISHALSPFPKSMRTKTLEPGGLSNTGKVWASEVVCPGCGRRHLDSATFERAGRECWVCHTPLYPAAV